MSKKPVIKNEQVEEPAVTIHEGIFQIVKNNGNYIIGVADKVICKQVFATKEEAIAYIDKKPWDLIINVSCLCYDMSKKTKTNNNQ